MSQTFSSNKMSITLGTPSGQNTTYPVSGSTLHWTDDYALERRIATLEELLCGLQEEIKSLRRLEFVALRERMLEEGPYVD